MKELKTQRVFSRSSSHRMAAMIVLGCAYWAALLAFLRVSVNTRQDFFAHLHVVSVLLVTGCAPALIACVAFDSTRMRFSNRVVALLAALVGYSCSAVLLCIGRTGASTLFDNDWTVYCRESELAQPLAVIFIGQLAIGFAVYWILERTCPPADSDTRFVATQAEHDSPALWPLEPDAAAKDADEMGEQSFDRSTPTNRSGALLRFASLVVFGAGYWVMLVHLMPSTAIGPSAREVIVATFLAACWFVPVWAGCVAADLRSRRGGSGAIVALACGVGTLLPILLAIPAPLITGVATVGSREFVGYRDTVGYFFPIMLVSGLAISGGVHLIRVLTR